MNWISWTCTYSLTWTSDLDCNSNFDFDFDFYFDLNFGFYIDFDVWFSSRFKCESNYDLDFMMWVQVSTLQWQAKEDMGNVPSQHFWINGISKFLNFDCNFNLIFFSNLDSVFDFSTGSEFLILTWSSTSTQTSFNLIFHSTWHRHGPT